MQPRAPQSTSAPKINLAGIILAAGKGTRMKSALPKVLHPVQGSPMLAWVLQALRGAGAEKICAVLGEDLTGFESFLAANKDLSVATQKNRLGTGDAVASAAFCLTGVAVPSYAAGRCLQGGSIRCEYALICAGDTPAIAAESLKRFVDASIAAQAVVSVLGMRVPNPYGYGRLVSQGDELIEIVEEKDADPLTRSINVCNSGVILARTTELFELLGCLSPDNAQREYYLTDIVKLARAAGHKTFFHVEADWESFAGVNDRIQLATVEAWMLRRTVTKLMGEGVSFQMPDSCYVGASVVIGTDSQIEPNVTITGDTKIGKNCLIAAGCRINGAEIGEGARIGAGSVIANCKIVPGEVVSPLSVRMESGPY